MWRGHERRRARACKPVQNRANERQDRMGRLRRRSQPATSMARRWIQLGRMSRRRIRERNARVCRKSEYSQHNLAWISHAQRIQLRFIRAHRANDTLPRAGR